MLKRVHSQYILYVHILVRMRSVLKPALQSIWPLRASCNLLQLRKKVSQILPASILKHLPLHASEESLWPQIRNTLAMQTPKRLCVLMETPAVCERLLVSSSPPSSSSSSDDGKVYFMADDTPESLQDPKRYQACYNFIRDRLVQDEDPIYISTYIPDATPQESYFIMKQIVHNIYNAARDAKYYQQLQVVLHSDPAYLNVYEKFNKTSLDALFAGNPISDVQNDPIVILPCHFEEDYFMFHNKLYKRKREMLKTIIDFEEYVKEAYKDSDRKVVSITIEDIRAGSGGVVHIQNKLSSLEYGSIVIVNAVHYHDLHVFVLAALKAETDDGMRFVYRAADSFIASYLGKKIRPMKIDTV